jgi:hypothetical protein
MEMKLATRLKVSGFTAIIIASRNDILTSATGPSKEGKFSGWITLGEAELYRPLINTPPIFYSEEEAKSVMDELVDGVRESVNPNEDLNNMFKECCQHLNEKDSVRTKKIDALPA